MIELCEMTEEDLQAIIGTKNGKDLRAFLDKKVELVKDEEFDEK